MSRDHGKMAKNNRPKTHTSKIGLFGRIAVVLIMLTTAGIVAGSTNAAPFAFIDSVKAYFGMQSVAAVAATDLSNGNMAMEPAAAMATFWSVSPISQAPVNAGATQNYGWTFTALDGAAGLTQTLVIPAGWSVPQTGAPGGAGYVSVTQLTCPSTSASVVGNTITLTNSANCTSSLQYTVNYANAVAPLTAGPYEFTSGPGVFIQPVVDVVDNMTSTGVGSSANPSTYGQSVTITATVTPGVTAGSVTFIEGGTCASPTVTLQAATPVNGSGQVTLITSSLLTGGHTITACYGGSLGYSASEGSLVQTVDKATPIITWANPADITYGTALSGTQLNASADTAGSFVYTPVSGTVLNVGMGQNLHVDFTPTDTANYNNAMADVSINVTPALSSLVERPGTANWFYYDDVANAVIPGHDFVVGPAGGNRPVGSAHFSNGVGDLTALGTQTFNGTRLDQITTLTYDTYVAMGGGSAPSLQFNVDFDLMDMDESYQGRVVFVPSQNGAVVDDTWQSWDATNGLFWYSPTFSPFPGECTQAVPCTRSQILMAHPNIGIHNGPLGALLFRVESNSDSNVDNLHLVANTDTMVNFEPPLTVVERPGTTDWFYYDDTPDTVIPGHDFVAGPATPPLQLGSARFLSAGSVKKALMTTLYGGTRFADFTAISYDTYVATADAGNGAPSLQFNVDGDLTDAVEVWQGRLNYIAVSASRDVWEPQDVMNGMFWYTRPDLLTGGTVCTLATPCTRMQVLSEHPNVGVHRNVNFITGTLLLRTFQNTDSNADNLTLGVSGASTTYDFEQGSSTTTINCPATSPYTGSPVTPCTASYMTSDGSTGAVTPIVYTPQNIDVGTVTATATFISDNYTSSSDSTMFDITPINQTALVVTAPASVTYPGPGQILFMGGSGTGAVTYSSSGSTGCSADTMTGVITVTDASGTCDVTVSKAGDNNYNPATSGSFAVALVKATPTAVLTVSNSPVLFDSNPHSAMVIVAGSSVPGTVANISGASGVVTVGDYPVTADFVPNDTNNYSTLTGVNAGTFSIVAASTPVVETLGTTDWFYYNDQPDVVIPGHDFVVGPGTPTLPVGSARFMSSDPAVKMALMTHLYDGVRFADIGTLSYDTYDDPLADPLNVPAFQFNVDFDLTDMDTSFQGRVVYEAYLNGTVVPGTWQHWDVMDPNAKFWYSRTLPFGSQCTQAVPCTRAQMLSLHPNMGVHATPGLPGGVLFRTNPLVKSYLDNFTIGVNVPVVPPVPNGPDAPMATSISTYDFEPGSSTVTVTCGAGPYTYNGLSQNPCTAYYVTSDDPMTQVPLMVSYTPDDINAGPGTANATWAGDDNHTGSTNSDTFTINKAPASVVVMPYNVMYDAMPHSATVVSITGVNGEMGRTVGTVDVSNTTHTNAGNYPADFWFFTGTSNYLNIGNTTIADNIGMANQTINFAQLPDVPFGTAPFMVSATATSGLPVSFASTTMSVCTVSGNTVTILSSGSCNVRASQGGDSNWNAAPDVDNTFNVTYCAIVYPTPVQESPTGLQVLVPVYISDLSDGPMGGVVGVNYRFHYNSAVLQPVTVPMQTVVQTEYLGTIIPTYPDPNPMVTDPVSWWTIDANTPVAGEVRISMFDNAEPGMPPVTHPLPSSGGILLYIKFNVIGATGTSSPTSFSDIEVNGMGGCPPAAAGVFNVVASDTMTTIASSMNPSVFGDPVTFTATVTSLTANPVGNTGSVQFVIDGNPYNGSMDCTGVGVTAGVATCTASDLAVGTHSVVANYTGAPNFNPSNATLTPQQVVAAVLRSRSSRLWARLTRRARHRSTLRRRSANL